MKWSLVLLLMVTKARLFKNPAKGERQDTCKKGKFPSKSENKQSLIVTATPFKVPVKPKIKEQTYALTQERRKRPPLQEMQEKNIHSLISISPTYWIIYLS